MTELIRFRGPDAHQIWTEESAGLGHTMLRTTDEAGNEQQPCSLETRFWITADVRIDARQELIELLESARERPRHDVTDPELILHAYRAWGEQLVSRLIGDFAFAIWDKREKTLFCARDHMGVKLLYFSHIGSTFVFSNTLDCVRSHPIVPSRINDAAVGDFLIAGWNQDPASTMFADVRQLPPAHTLSLQGNTVRTTRYWNVPLPTERKLRDNREYVERFSRLLRQATADRIRSDSVSILMSGGLDSPAVGAVATEALAARPTGRPLNALTIAYASGDGDEAYFARLAGDRLGIPIKFLTGNDWGYFEGYTAAVRQSSELRDNPLFGFAEEQHRLAASHGRVLLTGFDGDALLAQSRKAYISHLIETRSWYRFMRTTGSFIRAMRRLPTLGLRGRLASSHSKVVRQDYYPSWLAPEFEKRLNLRDRYDQVMNRPVPPEYKLREHAYSYLTASNWNRLFTDEDPGVTGVPVESRHPLADVRLIEFSMSLPQVPWCIGKHILRVAMKGILPEPLLNRRKTGFSGSPRASSPEHESLAQGLVSSGNLRHYVQIDRLPIRRDDGRLETHWLHLRPLELGHWLRTAAQAPPPFP